MPAEVSIEQYGDIELWVTQGVRPEGRWAIPLYVRRYKDKEGGEYVRASPVQPITPPQADQLKQQLNRNNLWEREDSFILSRVFFELRAKRADGITPDYYRVWPGVDSQLPVGPDTLQAAAADLPETDDTFLNHVSRRRGIKLSLLKLAWFAIQVEAPHWLLGRKRPLDLGFARIHAFPLRQNWKQIFLHRAPWIAPFFKKPKQDWELELTKNGFLPLLCKAENMAINAKEQIEWCLEAVPSPEFRTQCQKLETNALLHGQSAYVTRYERLILQLKEAILDTFAAFLEAISLPTGQICEGFKPSSRRLACSSVKGKKFLSQFTTSTPDALPPVERDLCIVVSDEGFDLSQSCLKPVIPKETAGVQALSNLLAPIDDLWKRDGPRALPESTDESL